jgi:hypothetical protein
MKKMYNSKGKIGGIALAIILFALLLLKLLLK